MNENQWITVAISGLALLGTIANGFIGVFKQKTELQHNAKLLENEAKTKYQQQQIEALTVNQIKISDALKICDEQHHKSNEEKIAIKTELAILKAKLETTVPTPVLHVPAQMMTAPTPPEAKG
jgi:Tfp pilus assembly protein PilO